MNRKFFGLIFSVLLFSGNCCLASSQVATKPEIGNYGEPQSTEDIVGAPDIFEELPVEQPSKCELPKPLPAWRVYLMRAGVWSAMMFEKAYIQTLALYYCILTWVGYGKK